MKTVNHFKIRLIRIEFLFFLFQISCRNPICEINNQLIKDTFIDSSSIVKVGTIRNELITKVSLDTFKCNQNLNYTQALNVLRDKFIQIESMSENENTEKYLKLLFLSEFVYSSFSFQFMGFQLGKTNHQIAIENWNNMSLENAFLHQLIPGFAEWMKLKVDLENALSVFSMIQKPDMGGELFLYDLEWKNFEYKLNESSYEERHNIYGLFFSSRGIENPKRKSIELDNGDTVIFRAAQIWHAINKIEGNKNRITLGCFIALGYDKKLYFWS